MVLTVGIPFVVSLIVLLNALAIGTLHVLLPQFSFAELGLRAHMMISGPADYGRFYMRQR